MSTLNERAGKALAGRWRAGMLLASFDSRIPPFRVEYVDPCGYLCRRLGNITETCPPEDRYPDLNDAATRGGFLDVVREAWGDPGAHTRRTLERDRWALVLDYPPGGPGVYFGATEAEALVAALESAPR
jgi:hypothetical protein